MEKSFIGKMIERFKLNKGAILPTAKKVVALGLILATITTTTTGCIFNFNNKKSDATLTPDNITSDVGSSNDNVDKDGPSQGNAEKEEKPLNSSIPSLDTDVAEPDLGDVEDVKDEETTAPDDKQEDVKVDKEETKLDKTQVSKIMKTLKSSINAELQSYFKTTKTTDDAKYSVDDIVYVQANSKNIEIGFTTDAGTNGGYSVITVGNATDSEKVEKLIGGLTSKAYLATMTEDSLKDLVNICSEAVEDSGIAKNIDTFYLIPTTDEVDALGNYVIAYYKSFNPNSENCKKINGGFEYSANVMIQDANGMNVETVSVQSAARLGKREYFNKINDVISGELTETEETGLSI